MSKILVRVGGVAAVIAALLIIVQQFWTELVTGPQENLADSCQGTLVSAHWWPPFLPTGGHETAHLGWGREEPGVSRTGDFGFSYAARWFSNHSRSTSLGVIYPKAE